MAGYAVERSITIDAPATRVRELVEDFRQWTAWSPWEGMDPGMRRTYAGAERGVGASYEWSGNRKVGAGSMEILEADDRHVGIDLRFTKPFRSASANEFRFEPAGGSTTVRWLMSGENTGMMALFGKVFSMDRMIGKDFEKGLARLKAVAELSPD